MNVKPGDLAYVVVPPGFKPLLAGRFLDVLPDGFPDDFHPNLTPEACAQFVARTRRHSQCWYVRLHNPVVFEGTLITTAYLLDSWLRPIRSPGEDTSDESVKQLPASLEAVPA